MKRVLLITALALLAAACSRQTNPQPTPASQSDNAAASAPNGVGSQRQDAQRPDAATGTTGATAPGSAPPSATGVEQAGDTTQSATSRSSADQQGVTASPPQ